MDRLKLDQRGPGPAARLGSHRFSEYQENLSVAGDEPTQGTTRRSLLGRHVSDEVDPIQLQGRTWCRGRLMSMCLLK